MRNVVRATADFFLVIGIILSAALVSGAAQAAEPRVIITPDADYPGFDYNTSRTSTSMPARPPVSPTSSAGLSPSTPRPAGAS